MTAALVEPEIVTKKDLVSVILPTKPYQKILEWREDASDVAWLEKETRTTR